MKGKKAIWGVCIVVLIVILRIMELWKDNANFENYDIQFKTISEFVLKCYPETTDISGVKLQYGYTTNVVSRQLCFFKMP